MIDLQPLTKDGVLSEEQLIRAANKKDPIHTLVDTALKGPELELPPGYYFVDTGGHERREIRRKWWDSRAESWREMAMSVPDLEHLPDEKLPDHVMRSSYPIDAPPVFFGHYWMEGDPVRQTGNALCLDYSAGKDGPLVSCGAEPGREMLSLDCLRIHL